MAAATTRRITVEIEPETARALWAAMHQDDDLACSYADLAIIYALGVWLSNMSDDTYDAGTLAIIQENLGPARAKALRREEEISKRFVAYLEPPF